MDITSMDMLDLSTYASASVGAAQTELQVDAAVAMLDNSMDLATETMDTLLEGVTAAMQELGRIVDVKI